MSWPEPSQYQEAIQTQWNPSTPSYYVLDPQGVIRHKWQGKPDNEEVEAAIDGLLRQVPKGKG